MNRIAAALSEHFAGLSVERIPNKHIADAKMLVRDYIGVALGGSTTDSGRIAAEFAIDTGGKQEATLIGNGARVPAVHAAFANAIASHSIELDDVDELALFHFSPPVVSAAIAVAERQKNAGAEFIAAVVGGCEMLSRASAATNPSLRNRGFHTTPTCGVFGAAVSAGMLLKLTSEQMVSALGLAGAQASGLMEMYGPSMQKRFNPGPTARNGVTAAVMAKLGFTGADTIFDGERGFCRAFTDEAHLDELTNGLGTTFPIAIEFKPYSSARPIHNAIDCALAIRGELKSTNDIARIVVRRHPMWAHYHQNASPATYHEAQVSLPFSIAVAFIEGAALLAQYQDDRLANPEIQRLARMTEILPDDSLPRGVSCLMRVETRAGRSHEAQIDHPRGSIVNPMTHEEMSRKAHKLGDGVIAAAALDRALGIIGTIESAAGISDLMSSLSPARN